MEIALANYGSKIEKRMLSFVSKSEHNWLKCRNICIALFKESSVDQLMECSTFEMIGYDKKIVRVLRTAENLTILFITVSGKPGWNMFENLFLATNRRVSFHWKDAKNSIDVNYCAISSSLSAGNLTWRQVLMISKWVPQLKSLHYTRKYNSHLWYNFIRELSIKHGNSLTELTVANAYGISNYASYFPNLVRLIAPRAALYDTNLHATQLTTIFTLDLDYDGAAQSLEIRSALTPTPLLAKLLIQNKERFPIKSLKIHCVLPTVVYELLPLHTTIMDLELNRIPCDRNATALAMIRYLVMHLPNLTSFTADSSNLPLAFLETVLNAPCSRCLKRLRLNINYKEFVLKPSVWDMFEGNLQQLEVFHLSTNGYDPETQQMLLRVLRALPKLRQVGCIPGIERGSDERASITIYSQQTHPGHHDRLSQLPIKWWNTATVHSAAHSDLLRVAELLGKQRQPFHLKLPSASHIIEYLAMQALNVVDCHLKVIPPSALFVSMFQHWKLLQLVTSETLCIDKSTGMLKLVVMEHSPYREDEIKSMSRLSRSLFARW